MSGRKERPLLTKLLLIRLVAEGSLYEVYQDICGFRLTLSGKSLTQHGIKLLFHMTAQRSLCIDGHRVAARIVFVKVHQIAIDRYVCLQLRITPGRKSPHRRKRFRQKGFGLDEQ